MTEQAFDTNAKDRPFRRTVFFISGFHDFGFRFFWPMLKRGARRHTKLYGRKMKAEQTDQGARLEVDDFGRAVEVDYRYLAWNDLAAKRINQPLWQIYWHMIFRLTYYHLSLEYFKLMRAYWGFTNGVYYMLFTMLISSSVVFAGCYAALSSVIHGPPLWAACAIAAYILPCLFFERYENYFRLKLMWLIFRMALSQGKGQATDLEERLSDFVERVEQTVRTSDLDEVLVVGHSYGSILATEVVGHVLAQLDNKPTDSPSQPTISLLTIGDINALYALRGATKPYIKAFKRLSTAKDAYWMSVFCPQDGLNFPKYNVAQQVYKLKEAALPQFRSQKVRELLTSENYKTLRKSFWDMHFQYLKEGDFQGDFSYFRMIASARPLRDNYGIRPEEEAYAKKQQSGD